MIPLFKVRLPQSILDPLRETLFSGFIGQGKRVDEFERQLGERFGNKRVLTVNSGTSAIQLALMLARVGPGDEVIVSPMTCSASCMPILMSGAKIVWSDIGADGNIDPVSVWHRWTPRTKAVIAVHWGGYPCDLDKLNSICTEFGGALIEDAAHAFGASYRGEPIGSISDFTCFSFQAIKHLTTVDGGALTCRDEADYRRGKLLRWYGIDRECKRQDFRCLHPKTKIILGDGRKIRAHQLAAIDYHGLVLCTENGSFTHKNVLAWHKNEIGDRHFIRITTTGFGHVENTMVTNDHLIMTPDGWRRADEIKDGDLIATSTPAPSKIQREILVGSLLGDGTITCKSGKRLRGVFAENHTFAEGEYVRLKCGALAGLRTKLIEVAPSPTAKRPNGAVMFYTPSLPAMAEFKKKFYPNRKKVVPRELVEKEFSPIMLAIWYMDDGSTDISNTRAGLIPQCQIATCSFSEDDVRWLVSFLNSRGYSCSTKNHSGCGWRIFFDKAGSIALVDTIAPYVPPSMRCKVGHSQAAAPFDWLRWGDGKSGIFFDHAIMTPYNDGVKHVHCLTVEGDDHSVATSAIVVHNCEADIVEAGTKYHMNDVAATIGIEQLKTVDQVLAAHRENAAYYREQFMARGIKSVRPLEYADDRVSSYWLFTVLADDRDGFVKWMNEHGVMTSRVHQRNDIHTYAKPYYSGPLPGVDYFAAHEACIPVGWWLTHEDRETVMDAIEGWDKNQNGR